ncbi:MAG: hypothetical protein K0U41_08940 [Gammaproteobacteria bacterium]|nr:hypothetical protein [Gammaproteobacteria bacterium]
MVRPLREKPQFRLDLGTLVAVPGSSPTSFEQCVKLVKEWHTSLGLYVKLYPQNLFSSGVKEMLDLFTLFMNNINRKSYCNKIIETLRTELIDCRVWAHTIEELQANISYNLLGSTWADKKEVPNVQYAN